MIQRFTREQPQRVHVNADRVENDLADGPEDDSGVNHSTQRGPMPL